MSQPTLFLDRDGVINVRTPGDYVKTIEEFAFEFQVPEALGLLAPFFHRIVVVTNQSGIGKGLMTESHLDHVHAFMTTKIQKQGGRIDGIYYCPHRSDAGCNCRKPAPGMAFQAQADFPDIDFRNAWLAGDSVCDMELAQSLGMHTILIEGKDEEAQRLADMQIDHRFPSLWAFAQWYITR